MTLTDILDACAIIGLPYGPPRGNPVGNISIACPVALSKHGDRYDTNFSCSVSYGYKVSLARCFSSNCGFKGSFIRLLRDAAKIRPANKALDGFIRKHEGTERRDLTAVAGAIEQLYEPNTADDDAPAVEQFDPQVLSESVLDGFDRTIHPYAVSRGISQAAWDKWGLLFDQERQRVVFPVRRHNGKLVGITGRDVTGQSDRKYHNYAGLKRSEVLFGEQHLKEDSPFVIVEGQIDAIIVSDAVGIPAVAPLGEGFSPYHVNRVMETNPPHVILFPDNDSAGRLQASKIAYALEDKLFLMLALPPKGKDPADLTPDEICACIENATPVIGTVEWPV